METTVLPSGDPEENEPAVQEWRHRADFAREYDQRWTVEYFVVANGGASKKFYVEGEMRRW